MKHGIFLQIADLIKRFVPIRTVTVAALLLFTTSASAFSSSGYKHYSSLPEPLPTSKGELIYQEMGCVMCHGIQGDGNGFLAEGLNPKPRDFTNYKVMSRIPDQSIRHAIKNGIAGTGMPSFSLSDEQIEELTVYLRSFLAESYLTVNACLMDTQVVDTRVDTADYRVEVENPELIQVKKDGTMLYIIPNSLKVAKRMSHRKVSRTQIRLVHNQAKASESRKYLSLVSVRVHKCLR